MSVLQRAMRNLPADTTLILNADDPRVAYLAPELENPRLYFGIEDTRHGRDGIDPTSDCPRCPRCGGELTYGCVFYAHLGHWMFPGCGLARPAPQVRLTKIDLLGSASSRVQAATGAAEMVLEIPIPGLYNAYNAARSICLMIPGNDPSSTSNSPMAWSSAGRWPERAELATSVVASPDSWFEPSRLSIGRNPAACITWASIRQVVPLPFEPVTSTAPRGISVTSPASVPGSMASATAPGTAEPSPLPSRRLPPRTALPIDTAKARRADATEFIWAALIAVNGDRISPEYGYRKQHLSGGPFPALIA
jgi:hypothetical protein